MAVREGPVPEIVVAIIDEILEANGSYADSFGGKAELPLPPARKLAILTCMDARLDPAKYAGLQEGMLTWLWRKNPALARAILYATN